MRMSALIAASLATLGFVQIAGADATDNLGVSATVASGCTITGSLLAFGTYDTVSGSAVDSTALVRVACTSGTETAVMLGEGANASIGSTPAAPDRRMNDGSGNLLSYSLFQNSQRSAVWGDTLGTGKPYFATSSAETNQTVYGRIAASQDVPAGDYTDTVLATIAF
jgi:spore coat protein U-like protein